MSAVGHNTVVTLSVDLSDAQGEALQEPGQRVTYLHGGYGGMLDAIELALEGKGAGDRVQLHLEPEQAFGDYDEERLFVEPRSRYGDGLEQGMQIEDLADDRVVLDGNHPFAGVALRVSAQVLAVRPASDEEVRLGEPVLD